MIQVLRVMLLIGVFAAGSCTGQVKEKPKKSVKENTVSKEKAVTKVSPPEAAAASPSEAKEWVNASLYEEIIQILQARYADPSIIAKKKVREAAVQSIFASLEGTVRFLDSKTALPPNLSNRTNISGSWVLDPSIGYLRLKYLESETAKRLENEVQTLVKEKHVLGLILDLRFAQGVDYSAVPQAASIFLGGASPLFSIQRRNHSKTFQATPSPNTTNKPLVVLVNHQTKGAAEALAAVLQDQGRALAIGNSATAGLAFEASDIPLSNGQTLQVATGKIILPHRGDFFLKGLQPDVAIVLDEKLEKEIYDKDFQPPQVRVAARLINEAILTGRALPPLSTDEEEKRKRNEPASNRDTVLLSAIDLLKSIQALELSTPGNRFSKDKS